MKSASAIMPKTSWETPARPLAKGIGEAVAARTILRRKPDGSLESWGDVAYRVALGNSMLRPEDSGHEFEILHKHLRQASVLMSGRHLQHGDETQPGRNIEVYSNCSTSASTFILFYLLLNGSGVGRSYDDDMMLVDWSANMPHVVQVIRHDHPDVLTGEIGDEFVNPQLPEGLATIVFEVPDSREGWAKAVEQIEFLTWEGTHADKVLLLDFSAVRHRGSPIKGMQNRPASGPGPIMDAIKSIATIKNSGLAPWKAAMHADHYAAECVLVGGARRAARMATKSWRDKTVFEFIAVKKGGVLWSSNNSVTVDEEFWKLVKADIKDIQATESGATVALAEHAKEVFEAICASSYHDGTGEPGIINVERLTQKNEGVEVLFDGDYAASDRFQLDEGTKRMTAELAKVFAVKKFQQITNPCVTADTWVQTSEGPRQVRELIDTPYKAVVDGKQHKATGFWKTGDKEVFRVVTNRGYEVRATADHKILVEALRKRRLDGSHNVEQEWIEVQDLQPGDKLVLNNLTQGTPAGMIGAERDQGWLLGEMVGDGGYNPDKYRGYVRFWGHSEGVRCAQMAVDLVAKLPDTYHAPVPASDTPGYNAVNDTWTVASRKLCQLADGLISEGGKSILPALEKKSRSFVSGFLRGLFDADGSVQGNAAKGLSVRLAQNNLDNLKAVQRMLLRLGVASTIYQDRREEGERMLPSGIFGSNKAYLCAAQHELVISKNNIIRFALMVGFHDQLKAARLEEKLEGHKARGMYAERFTAEVEAVIPDGVEAVYDCTVDDVHRFDANGIIVHNCGEISLALVGAYCLIADVAPYHAGSFDPSVRNGTWMGSTHRSFEELERTARAWDNDAEDAFRAAVRALIRTNTMNALYQKEVDRTNRIGVGPTGLHEYAWARFGFGWKDIVNEEKSIEFWQTMSRFSNACVDEAIHYADKLGVATPHTVTTCKPSGTVSKLFSLTEGVHLPAMGEYLRWVQFRNDDPLIEQYRANGYTVKELKTYSGTTIVGFPTIPEICKLGMGELLVTAPEATPEEQYRFLQLLEKYWIDGYREGIGRHSFGNQVSYTLKLDMKKVSFEEFRRTLMDGQSTVKCCSVMPAGDTSAYEYLPETPVTPEEFRAIVDAITDDSMKEDIGLEHVGCGTGGCPIDFEAEEKVA